MSENQLGTFLKARRASVKPEEAGLPRTGTRRVPGLRREEVASLAGLSVDYYTRLEQGREQHPSPSVLNALAQVLRLSPDAQRYLFAIATAGPRVQPRHAKVSDNLIALISELTDHPVVIMDDMYNVVAHNHLGRAIYAGHQHSDNIARLIFLDPGGRTFYRDWNRIAWATVAGIRAAATHYPGHSGLLALIGELTVRSEEFSKRWAKAEVQEKTTGHVQYHHPIVGDLDLNYETLRLNGTDLLMKMFRAEPATEMADKLAMLGSITAEDQIEAPEDLNSRKP
ncbi:helix-turn-helix transcriptional regulator [Actinocrispum sp. NPDC049592]|uniref:helix-turn-helix transcriptional regulator n=1 Tax=Actinocrispum sp. NPDC049592 TaxID=3154835 RepID=UPI00342BECEA